MSNTLLGIRREFSVINQMMEMKEEKLMKTAFILSLHQDDADIFPEGLNSPKSKMCINVI